MVEKYIVTGEIETTRNLKEMTELFQEFLEELDLEDFDIELKNIGGIQ